MFLEWISTGINNYMIVATLILSVAAGLVSFLQSPLAGAAVTDKFGVCAGLCA